MITVTCDRCGRDISAEGHWRLEFVDVDRGGRRDIRERRNQFCTDCW